MYPNGAHAAEAIKNLTEELTDRSNHLANAKGGTSTQSIRNGLLEKDFRPLYASPRKNIGSREDRSSSIS